MFCLIKLTQLFFKVAKTYPKRVNHYAQVNAIVEKAHNNVNIYFNPEKVYPLHTFKTIGIQ